MAKTVDDRVVSMSFETQKFTQGVSTTLSSIDKLKSALRFGDVGKGFSDIEKAASKVSLSGASSAIDKLKSRLSFGREASEGLGEIDKAGNKVKLDGPANAVDKLRGKFQFPEAANAFAEIEKGSGRVTLSGLGQALDGIGNKFGVLQGVASVAIGNIVSKLSMIGGAKLKEFSLGPITDGLHEYETNLNSIQTILANTRDQGTNLKQVNAALQNLNTYSDKTIYNFSQMAKNIGTFTAAGVDLKTATTSIKGIANLAAVSGSSAEQASTAMYQLSQAIASGRVSLQDWNSVVNAGMGGAVFQKALMRTAQSMGTLKDSAVQVDKATGHAKINGESFRESIMAKPGEQSWLTSDVLTKTLSQLSGDLTDAQLKAQGFSDAQIKAIQSQAKMAVNAATQVKTLSQLLSTIRESIGSGWAQTWQIILGNFGEAKSLFTGLSNAIGGFVKTSSNARNAVLGDWKALGGRKILIEGLKDAFAALKSVVEPIKAAFRDVFPRKTGQDLLSLTKRFRDFMESLKVNSITAANLRSTFKGLFAILDIGVQVVKGIFSGIGALFGELSGDGASTLTNFTGNIGDAIYAFDQWLKSGNRIGDFFKGLGKILAQPLKVVKSLAEGLNNLLNSSGLGSLSSSAGNLNSSLSPLGDTVNGATGAFRGFLDILKKVGDFAVKAVQTIAEPFANIGDAIAQAISSNDFSNVFSVIQTGLMAGILLTIKKALGGGLKLEIGTGGALAGITKSLNTLNGSLTAIQNNIKANTMLQIAAAVALLAVSAVALSSIDPKKLTTAMTALTVSMGQLMASLFIMDKVGGKAGFVKAPLIAASLIGIATAIDILVLAVLALSRVDPKKLATGLAGLTGMLAAVSLAIFPLSKAGPGLLIAAPALIGIATAITILSGAVLIFATMNWGEMLRGLAGVVLAIDALGLSSRALAQSGPGMIIAGVGLTAMGVGLTILGGALKIFGSMDWATIGKGLAAMAGTLLAIGIAMGLMPPTLPLIGAGLILVGIGMTALAGVLAVLGNMNVATLAKGIIAMGASLLVLAVGLNAMMLGLPGAAALVVVATGLAILVPTLAILGNMKFSTIAKGLGFMLASIVALALASVVAAPALIALGIALSLLGAGITLVGAGLYLMTSALVKLAGPGAKGIAVTLAAFTAFVAILPKVIINFLKGVVEILAATAALAPNMAKSIAKILDTMLTIVIKEAPRFAQAMTAIITSMIAMISKNAPLLIKAGAKILLALLQGIDKNIVQVTKRAISIITKFINTVASKANQLVTAGLNLLISFLKGIANNLGKVASAALSIVTKFIGAIIGQASKIIRAATQLISSLLSGFTKAGSDIIAAGVKIVTNLVKGIGNATTQVVTAALRMATKFIVTLAGQIPKEVDRVATAIIKMLNALAGVIRKREPEFIKAMGRIGIAISEGIVAGMTGLGKMILKKIKDEVTSLPGKGFKLVKKALGAKAISDAMADVLIGKTDFTSKVKGFLRGIENSFLKQFISFGEDNIRTIQGLAEAIGTTLKDGLLTGFEFAPADPAWEALKEIVNQVSGTQDQIEQSTRTSVLKIKDLNAQLAEDYRARDNARKKHDHEAAQSAINSIKQHKDEIAQEEKVIESNNKLIAVLNKVNGINKGALTDPSILDSLSKLIGWRQEVERLNGVLDTQIQKLEELKQKRTDLRNTTFEQFSAVPGLVTEDANGNKIDPAVQVQNYIDTFSGADDALDKFRTSLDTLQSMGLNSDTYKQLLDAGPAAQGFVDALIAMGPGAVNAINQADTDLRNVAGTLADHAASYMYDASIATWEGWVKGTRESIKTATDEAVKLVDAIVRAVKRKLHIKSPSQVFAQIGAYSVAGLAKGFADSSKMVTDAIYGVSDDAIAAMKKSMSGISDVVADSIDTNPTITPVLDLSQIQAGANQMGSILTVPVSSSLVLASGISVPGVDGDPSQTDQAAPIQFIQNNTSPESLSSIEIYRQTKNQLAQARPVLAK